MRNNDNKRPSAGKGSAGRGRSAGTGKPAFRDSSSPKRGRPAGKPSFGGPAGKPKDGPDSPFSRRNKPFTGGKDSSSYSPREHSGDRPSQEGDNFRTSGRGPSKYPRRDNPFSSGRDASSSRPQGDRPYESRDTPHSGAGGPKKYIRRDSPRSEEGGPKKYERRDKPFSSGKDSSSPRERGDRPYERKDSPRSEEGGPKKYVRHDKPFSSGRDSSAPRERGDRPYERKDSPRSAEGGPGKYEHRDKPYSSGRDSSVPREQGDRPYVRKDSPGSDDGSPKKYVRRDKPYSSDRDSSAPRERSDRPYERKDSKGSEDKGSSKYVRRDKPFSSDKDSSTPRERGDRPYKRSDSTSSEEKGSSNYPPRRERPAVERLPILDLREEKLKASGDWKEEVSPKGRPYQSKQTGDDARSGGSGNDKSSSARPARRTEAESIRLNKFIANAGVCSRREADVLIQAGAIKVNGIVVTELGVRVGPRDKVQYGDQTLAGEKMMYLLLNKPKGYITTSEDPYERKTVMELVSDACRERIYPVGRLDRNTTGLLLFTNDGDLAKKLTHPRHKVRKIYHVELDKALTKSDMIRITDGIELEDGVIKADEVAYTGESKREIGIELHSGKNRVVRRIFEVLEYDVVKLDRVSFAGLTKKDLPRGRWRFLTDSEVNYLKMLR
jgi:23S rRNA pseudouridine2605 synthase